MPTSGLSLFGFMPRDFAHAYFQHMCVPAPSAKFDFDRDYREAVARLGPAFPNAGRPNVQPVPGTHDSYLQGVQGNPRFTSSLQIPGLKAWSFKLVEIDPILSFQFALSKDFARRHSGNLSSPPTLNEMLTICLPHQLAGEPPIVASQPNRIQLTMKDMNYRLLGGLQHVGNPQEQVSVAGVFYALGSNQAQVIRCNHRTYIKNGFHRAYALRSAGATHMPCLYLETDDWSALGTHSGATFERELLESADPPTCAHYSQGRAFEVTLRTMTRIIEITWSDRTISDVN